MYRRLAPQRNLIVKILLPIVVTCAIATTFLVAFQCDPPRTWALDPSSCSTGGRAHYGAIGLNIFTDVILAFWIVPTIVALQAARSKKAVVIALVVSRLCVCVVDAGKIIYVRKALNSDDVTCKPLLTTTLSILSDIFCRELLGLGSDQPVPGTSFPQPCNIASSPILSHEPPNWSFGPSPYKERRWQDEFP